ncbi:MAG: histidine phosphatase family protein [Pseudomonadota bacterium]
MKTLCLVRHATAENNYSYDEDLIRPLQECGCDDAKRMAKNLANCPFQPQLIIASPAKRTQETARIFAAAYNINASAIKTVEKIYEASVENLLDVIQAIDDQYDKVLLVGHNPGISELGNYFIQNVTANLPTCGILCLKFATDSWSEILMTNAELVLNDWPRKDKIA